MVHDLICAYATELAQEFETPVDLRAAQQRILDHYRHTAYAANRLIDRTGTRSTCPRPRPGCHR